MAQRTMPLDLERLVQLLRVDDLDGAIEAGLMRCDPTLVDHASGREAIAAARQRLADAWAARERHRARTIRLQRRKREREASRKTGTASRTGLAGLPPAAAAALARAKAKAAAKP